MLDLRPRILRLASRSPRVAHGKPSAPRMRRSTRAPPTWGRPAKSCHSTAIPARRARSWIASSFTSASPYRGTRKCSVLAASRSGAAATASVAFAYRRRPGGGVDRRWFSAKVGCNGQHRTVAKPPSRKNRFRPDRISLDCSCGIQTRHDFLLAQQDQLPVERFALRAENFVAMWDRGIEGRSGIRIRDTLPLCRIRKRWEPGELIAPALAHGICQFRAMVGRRTGTACRSPFPRP